MLRLAIVFVFCLVIVGGQLGYASQPWYPFWVAARGTAVHGTVARDEGDATGLDDPAAPGGGDVAGPRPVVSDLERFLLAVDAGFSHDEAITAVAVSIAEDGGGDPNALSAVNRNGTRDAGLWQINSQWWPEFGGLAGVLVPSTNAHAAAVIRGRQGWCAWSTYGPCPTHTCGPPCWRTYLPRARAVAGS